MPRPKISYCERGPLKTDHNGHAQFVCQLSNYSEYVEVVVVEGNHTQYNKSTNDLSFSCSPNKPNPSFATCTVNISTSLHSGKLQYRLCVGYNATVQIHSRLQCSDNVAVTINSSKSSKLLKGFTILTNACTLHISHADSLIPRPHTDKTSMRLYTMQSTQRFPITLREY